MNARLIETQVELTEIMERIFRGSIIPIIIGNEVLDDKYENFSIQTDVNWPFGISEQEAMKQFKIESGIEIPRNGGQPLTEESKAMRDAVESLEINQSFIIPAADKTESKAKRLKIQIWLKKQQGKAFITRTVDGGLRIWRIQ